MFDQDGTSRRSHQRLTVNWAGHTFEFDILSMTPEALVVRYIISITGSLTIERFMIDWLNEQGLKRCWYGNWSEVATEDKLKANLNLARVIKVTQAIGSFCTWKMGMLAQGKAQINDAGKEDFFVDMHPHDKLTEYLQGTFSAPMISEDQLLLRLLGSEAV